MDTHKVASFFAGIGGFDLGFERAGMEVVFQCEIDSYAQKILKRHWPDVPLHGDICTLEAKDIPHSDVWTAGFPCQDVSNANSQRLGIKGERSGLFFEFTRLAAEAKPKWIVLENVVGLLSSGKGQDFRDVVNELEEIGYLGVWFTINTLSAGLPQHRERVFLVGTYRSEDAHRIYLDRSELFGDHSPRAESWETTETRPTFSGEFATDSPLLVQRRGGFGFTKARGYSPTLRAQTGKHQGGHSDRPILCGQKLDLGRIRETNGVPRGMDGRRGRLIGNSVAPPLAHFIATEITRIDGSSKKQVNLTTLRNAYKDTPDEDLYTIEGVDSATGTAYVTDYRDLVSGKSSTREAVNKARSNGFRGIG